MTCVHEKRIINPKIAIIDMKRAFFWLTEDLLNNDSPSKVRLSNSTAPKTALRAMHSQKGRSKKVFHACADKSHPCCAVRYFVLVSSFLSPLTAKHNVAAFYAKHSLWIYPQFGWVLLHIYFVKLSLVSYRFQCNQLYSCHLGSHFSTLVCEISSWIRLPCFSLQCPSN